MDHPNRRRQLACGSSVVNLKDLPRKIAFPSSCVPRMPSGAKFIGVAVYAYSLPYVYGYTSIRVARHYIMTTTSLTTACRG
mgnify:CR=1 FL=1